MMYKNKTHNLTAKFIDAKTNQQLFEITDRTADDIGELFVGPIVNNLMLKTLGSKKAPLTIIVRVEGRYDYE